MKLITRVFQKYRGGKFSKTDIVNRRYQLNESNEINKNRNINPEHYVTQVTKNIHP